MGHVVSVLFYVVLASVFKYQGSFRINGAHVYNSLPSEIRSASDFRDRNVPDCLPVSSDRQNIFLPVSTNIQLEQCYFNIILFSLFKTQLGLNNRK